MTGFHRDKYCHVLEAYTTEKDRFFFQSCLFVLEIEPLERAELLHYKLAVLKATQQWLEVKFTRLS